MAMGPILSCLSVNKHLITSIYKVGTQGFEAIIIIIA